MRNKNQLKSDSETLQTVKTLAESFEEISVMRMQRVRSSVLSTRNFLEKLSLVFFDVKTSYRQQIAEYIDSQKKRKIHLLPFGGQEKQTQLSQKNGKTLSIFISSNASLYGDIIYKVFTLFLTRIKKSDDNILIIGRHGRDLFEASQTKKHYQYFDLPDYNVTLENLKPVIDLVTQYETVRVYFGKFSNMITQLPEESNITGDEPLKDTLKPEIETSQKILETKGKPQKKVIYGFEPSLETILQVFESQVMSSLLKQAVNESELSRYASRIRAMEEARQNISEQENILDAQIRRFRQTLENKKQLNTLSGMSLWNK